MEHQLFTSRITTILTMLGVSIGLGNVWRFPYMMGSYGGSAFLVVYMVFTLLFAIPALMAEMTLGRMSGRGTLEALRLSFGMRAGSFFGYVLLIVITIAGSYYAVVVGNVLYAALFSIFSGFNDDAILLYNQFLANGWLQYLITIIVVGLSLLVIHRGLKGGIEYVSKLIMPVFFLVLIYMIAHALFLPDSISRFRKFLQPDLSVLHAREIFAAMGQAFFSVGLGGTFVIVYSGYFKRTENIPFVALVTGLGDAGASFMFGLFLVPSILVFGLDMSTGPKLIFETLPQLFMQMPGGRWVGSLFLLFIFIVAFLSLMAAYQVPFTIVQQEWSSLKSKKILLGIGLLQCALALPSSLYPDLIGVLDLIFGSGMQVLGSALCIVGLTWGIGRARTAEHLFPPGSVPFQFSVLYVWIKWIIPLALLAVLAGYVYGVAN